MDDQETRGATVTLSLSELSKISEHLCVPCRGIYLDWLSEMLKENERDRLERKRRECADQQEAELKRREFLSGD